MTSCDLASFWGCHTQAFAHFGGVPAKILYDRTKTVVKRHVGRGQDVPLHPEAVAFAAHYGFAITVAAAYRPQAKGRVERQVRIVRDNVLMGRTFTGPADMDAAFAEWLPARRGEVHRTHGEEFIAVRALPDPAALGALPPAAYVVCERHLRSVGKDCLVSFEASVYSVPWRSVAKRMKVELRVTADTVAIWTPGAEPRLLATHDRARTRGSWMVRARPTGRAGWRGRWQPTSRRSAPSPSCSTRWRKDGELGGEASYWFA